MEQQGNAATRKAHRPDDLVLPHCEEEDRSKVLAEVMLGQNLRHGFIASTFAGGMLQNSGETLGFMDCSKVVKGTSGQAVKGDLSFASAMLASQAMTLDSMFTEFARRAAINMGEYLGASERYGRLALKAQSNCRATLEALAKLHQPREQTVRHVHVNEGGQAVITDQFHHHAGGKENGESGKQSHATGPAGPSASLPCPDSEGGGMPITGLEREEALQDAWRDKSRRA